MDVTALVSRWTALPSRVRIFAGGAFALVVALSLVAGIVAHPQQTALFAGALQPDQLSDVQERLASWNVPFTPTADNVLVDAKRRGDLLLRLSMAGTPRAHVQGTTDALSKLGALTPQAVIDAQTRDGLAGDIELGLRGIAGIQDARVIIAPAKQGYFADDSSSAATASVRVTMQPGSRLSQEAVSGIRTFVAASVAGLDARNVKIVDDQGVALGEETGGDESELQRSLQRALDSSIGAGATIVRVRVEYDRRSSTSHDVRRAPLASMPIAANTQEERFSGSGKTYDKSSQDLDRGSETSEQTIAVQPGRISRISAAVFVDAAHVSDIVPIRTLAAAALGIDPRRGDTLEVQAMSFAAGPVARKDGWWLAYGTLVPLLPTLVLVAAVLIFVRYAAGPAAELVRGFNQRASIARTVADAHGIAPAGVRASLDGEPPHTAAAIISALPASTAAAVLEMYPEHERAAIVRRMHRPESPLFADAQRFVNRA
jgi:flagellar M-ring protein FliF